MSHDPLIQGRSFPKDIILHAVFFHQRYGVAYRDREEIMAERGVMLDHATLNRWVGRYAGLLVEDACRRQQSTDRPWHMDETCITVRGCGGAAASISTTLSGCST